MLKYKADRRTLLFMAVTVALLFVQWNLPEFNIWLWIWSMFMGVSCAVMAHNINHVPLWKNPTLNRVTDYVLTFLYGFPAFVWIPTHNLNHHQYTNKEGDWTITYRYSERNNLFTVLTYPFVSAYWQQYPTEQYIKKLWNTNRSKFYHSIGQYGVILTLLVGSLLIDWQKSLLFVVAPRVFGLYVVLLFNYIQHVHCDELSEYSHSRNWEGLLNLCLFNNGYHTAHHMKMGLHWSLLREEHYRLRDKMHPSCIEQSFWWYMTRVYILGMFIPPFRTKNLRANRVDDHAPVDLNTAAQPA